MMWSGSRGARRAWWSSRVPQAKRGFKVGSQSECGKESLRKAVLENEFRISYDDFMDQISSPPDSEMSPHNLWAVWTTTNEAFVSAGIADAVTQDWVLASEGPAGRLEAQSSAGDEFIAALSLADLQQAWDSLNQVEERLFERVMDRWLPFSLKAYALLIEKPEGGLVWMPVRARSEAQALELGGSFGRVIASGKFQDLKETMEEGKRILREKDYRQVLVDVRPITAEHPKFWLMYRKSPHLAADLKRLLESASHDG